MAEQQSNTNRGVGRRKTAIARVRLTLGKGRIVINDKAPLAYLNRRVLEMQATQPVFASAPMVIQETLLFPYINGADFVRRYKTRVPGKLPLLDMPISTKQLMHDSAFFVNRANWFGTHSTCLNGPVPTGAFFSRPGSDLSSMRTRNQ